jgi:hypothetical protein
MPDNNSNIFHLGLCMAGSVSAGAYTAGVIDYLIEALENWEREKQTDPSVPRHQVVIDLLSGASGGGITGAMTQFALMDKMDHAKLEADGSTYIRPVNNILWDCWVELSDGDVFEQILSPDDLSAGGVRSLLNAGFIDKIADKLNRYIDRLSAAGTSKPPFVGIAPEMFMTLFNITGIKYQLHSIAATTTAGRQYVADHRDIAHFRWSEGTYEGDGRMILNLHNREHVPVVIAAAKATGAFPVGLRARLVTRPAKYIWDNPFFNKGKKFGKDSILLGEAIEEPDQYYTSINADGGTANNEPVELARDIMLSIRKKKYGDVPDGKPVEKMSDVERADAKKAYLMNTSIILIDPFPSADNTIQAPDVTSDILFKYAPSLVNAMNAQLIFDAKDALDAYKKDNYGLHIIAPSRDGVDASIAIACGSLGGFGGFLEREFRVHDFFLGRKNCQGFLRKYFVANLNEADPENRACIQAIIDSYAANPAAKEKFAFLDEQERLLVPIIPDVSLQRPVAVVLDEQEKVLKAIETNKLPLFKLNKLEADFLEKYRKGITRRYLGISKNLFGAFAGFLLGCGAWLFRKKITGAVIDKIRTNLRSGELIK